MKKYLKLLMIGSLLLTGCTQGSPLAAKDETAPELQLTKKRVQVAQNDTVDYTSYISKANDDVDGDLKKEVTYNTIDTSKLGSYEVKYSVKDKSENEATQTLKVDVVKMFNDGIFDPTHVTPDTVKDPSDITVLVNKLHQIPEGWKPDDLEAVDDDSGQLLRHEAKVAYTKFYNAAKAKGYAIYSISGYRTNDTQTRYWTNMSKVYGLEYASQYSAYPGRSEHQLGLAIDVSYTKTGNRLSEAVADSDIGKFITSDGYKYGFILRYQKDKVKTTNYGYEPWHIRYVGVELATQLHDKGITLEEYYGE